MFELTLTIAVLLVLAGFLAGFIDSIAGGGGLIAVPALLLSGMDPVQALATNKVQGTFGSGTACWNYAARGLVDLRTQAWPAIAAGVASVAGASLVSSLPTDTLKLGLPVLLIAVALFFALKPGLSDADGRRRLGPTAFALTAAPLIGFYDGLLGPGAGSFYMIAFILLAGQGVLKATAHTKLLNFASNIGSLGYFALFANPLWTVGILMGLAQMAGARLGSGLAMKNGARIIRPLLVLTSTGMALRLIWQML
ncbi:MAG: TSUP family transporter [Paracoccaceae bacterium]